MAGRHRARAELAERLRSRRLEIEEGVLARVRAIGDPGETSDPGYAEGLRAAATAALDYGFTVIETGEERCPPVPVDLLAQARRAGRNDVGVDTVLRRYSAGYSLLCDFLIEEAESVGIDGRNGLKRLLRDQAALFDRLVTAVTEEHSRERESALLTPPRRTADRVLRLLAGGRLDPRELEYEMNAWHVGAIAVGAGTEEVLRHLADSFDRRILLVRREEETIWAWLGGRQRIPTGDLVPVLSTHLHENGIVAIGEPAQGIAGWRLTHRQADAVLSVATRKGRSVTRYAEAGLVASVLRDELLTISLRQMLLAPLATERDGGETLHQTLRAYLAAGCNVSSAAAALGVNRHTVTSRLRMVEQVLEKPLSSCTAEIDVALRLEDMA